MLPLSFIKRVCKFDNASLKLYVLVPVKTNLNMDNNLTLCLFHTNMGPVLSNALNINCVYPSLFLGLFSIAFKYPLDKLKFKR